MVFQNLMNTVPTNYYEIIYKSKKIKYLYTFKKTTWEISHNNNVLYDTAFEIGDSSTSMYWKTLTKIILMAFIVIVFNKTTSIALTAI